MADVWSHGEAYERFMGRWSRLLAPQFLHWLRAPAGLRWADVGCGSGALTAAILDLCSPARLTAVDPSQAQVAEAAAADPRPTGQLRGRHREQPPRQVVRRGGVGTRPQLRPRPRRRCLGDGPGGAGRHRGGVRLGLRRGMQMLRTFWDVACELDPDAADLNEGHRFSFACRGCSPSCGRQAGLEDVQTTGDQRADRVRGLRRLLVTVPRWPGSGARRTSRRLSEDGSRTAAGGPGSAAAQRGGRHDRPDGAGLGGARARLSWPCSALLRAVALRGQRHRRLARGRGLLLGERAVRRPEPQGERQRPVTLADLRAGVDVEEPHRLAQRAGPFAQRRRELLGGQVGRPPRGRRPPWRPGRSRGPEPRARTRPGRGGHRGRARPPTCVRVRRRHGTPSGAAHRRGRRRPRRRAARRSGRGAREPRLRHARSARDRARRRPREPSRSRRSSRPGDLSPTSRRGRGHRTRRGRGAAAGPGAPG